MRRIYSAVVAGSLILFSTSASAGRDCTVRDMAGRWHIFGTFLYGSHPSPRFVSRFRCAGKWDNGVIRYDTECFFEKYSGSVNDGIGDGGDVEFVARVEAVRKNCIIDMSFTLQAEILCEFKGAMTQDKNLISGVAVCQDFATEDDREEATMMMTFTKR